MVIGAFIFWFYACTVFIFGEKIAEGQVKMVERSRSAAAARWYSKLFGFRDYEQRTKFQYAIVPIVSALSSIALLAVSIYSSAAR